MARTTTQTDPLSVDDTGFLLDRLGADCAPLQFLRELTQNSIEAILRTPKRRGSVVWDIDHLESKAHGALKLCVTDNGDGMTGLDLANHINRLSSSGGTQGMAANFGVGAKIAAATRNHAGLIYLSWRASVGAMIHLWRDSRGTYGLRRFHGNGDGEGYFSIGEVDDRAKPDLIKQHGTRVTLLGMHRKDNTMIPPLGTASPSRWIARYLNGRYFRFPAGVKVLAREGWESKKAQTNLLREVEGSQRYLDKHAATKGKVELSNATAFWWILRDESALTQNSGVYESAGHVAALFQDELYELVGGRRALARLQQFGVIFGQRLVVIYIEPRGEVIANTARTHLLLDGEPLPWVEWAAEFRERMPDEIKRMMDAIASKSEEEDHSKTIRDRLREMLSLFKISRYRPRPKGPLEIEEPHEHTGGEALDRIHDGDGEREADVGPMGSAYSAHLKPKGIHGEEVAPNPFPEVVWVSVEDGTRTAGDMEDRAARYLPEQHLLLCNGDFRVFADMTDHWCERFKQSSIGEAACRRIVRQEVRVWYEQALVETVLGVMAFRGGQEWRDADINAALSEEGLTAAVMQRYHLYTAVSRGLAIRLHSLKT